MILNMRFLDSSTATIEVLPDDKIYKIYQYFSESGDDRSILNLDIFNNDTRGSGNYLNLNNKIRDYDITDGDYLNCLNRRVLRKEGQGFSKVEYDILKTFEKNAEYFNGTMTEYRDIYKNLIYKMEVNSSNYFDPYTGVGTWIPSEKQSGNTATTSNNMSGGKQKMLKKTTVPKKQFTKEIAGKKRIIHTGSKGGKYYILNNRKVYI